MFVIIGLLLAATAAQAEERKCNKASHCPTKNYVINPNEYGWSATSASDCTPKRGKGFGWKQKKDVLCGCLPDCSGGE